MVHQPNLDLTDRSSPGRACRSFAFGLLLAMMLGTACTPSNSPTEQATSATKREGTRSGEEPKRATSLRALKLLEANRFDEAWEECQKVLLTSPSDSRAIYVSAQVLMQRSKFEQAIGMVDRIPISDPEYGLQSRRDALNWCLGRSAVRQAENRALEILAKNPDDFETNKLFAALLDLQGRRYESSLIMQKLLRLGNSDITTLVLAIDTVKPIASDAISQQKLEAAPEELRLKGTLAFGTLYEKEPERAQALFEEIIGSGQATPAMWVGLGLALIEQEKWEALAAWHSNAPKDQMVQLPEYWRALGLWFQSMDRFEEAAKCFTRSLELDPMNYLAAGPLAQCLSAAGKIEEAQVAEKMFQASQLANRNLNYCRDGHRRPEWMNQLADTLDEHGRKLEAILWRESCEQANDPKPVRVKELEGIRKELLASKRGPELVTGLSRRSTDYPEIDWSLIAGSRGSNIPNPSKGSSTIGGNNAKLAWADVAKELGANVLYRNGDDPNVIGMQTYQSNGAGAGVIDYDRDGWPDLFVLQGGGDPREPDSNEAAILLKNRTGNRFDPVGVAAKTAVRAYGQGVAVGDWDQDGFPDLFVLNFGENRLLRNQGDGTFEWIPIDAMRRDVQQQPVWSVSGAIADIDGDHLPDLVEVNYASGIDVITHLCITKEKVPQVCRPTEFPASADYIYLSDGQGGFSLGNQLWNLPMDDGRGLGLIVGNIDGLHGNDLYIANDMSANNLYISREDTERSGKYSLLDEAVRRGCAVDNQGKPQASMGVACADIDRNGTLDLFMTNFIDEYNALYLQNEAHLFQDASRRYRLIDPKKKTLGFGTQAVDLDCDGWQDLMVVNGHVDDYRSKGQPYAMRPQVFLQRESGFIEQPNESLGKFFEQEYLSRSLGVWDFNRDGKLDQYVTHLDHPFSILRNDGEKLGNWIALELIGVRSERDAIGATVRVQAGGGQWVHQRLAGNGFECSNEGVVHIGLGNHEVIDVLEIQWPTGEKSRWEKVPTRRRLQVIEGHPELIEIGLVNGER